MKKKKFLTLVATGLMACLVAAMGGMTYSKYITSTKTEPQQATAAKWGFVMTADTTKLFGDAYNGADGASAGIVDYGTGISVKADTEGKFVVAPGTKGSMTIAINGTAEVRAQLSIEAGTTLDEIYFANVDYHPITWTLSDGVDSDNDVSGTLEEVLTAFEGKSAEIEANTTCTAKYTLSWEWPLEQGDDENIYDTMIGYKTYGRTWNEISAYFPDMDVDDYNSIETGIAFDISVKIAQIQ